MKAIILSIYLAISSFFGVKPQPTTQTSSVASEAAILASPSAEVLLMTTPMIKRIPTKTPTPTPTKPITAITEEVLRKFLGQSEKASIDRILNDSGMLKTYDDMFYAKFKKFPIPRLDTSKTEATPTKYGPIWCTGEQLKSLYTEIEKVEKDFLYKKMDYDCHYNRSMTETKECQEWRRVNDQNRKTVEESRDEILMRSIEKIYVVQNTAYDNLVDKYCVTKL